MKRNGFTPGPDRSRETNWSEFLRTHWESLAAIDFFRTEIYTLSGLTRYMVLVAIDYATRKVNVAGIIQQAHGEWMLQKPGNLADQFSGFLKDKKYLIHDRDPLFTGVSGDSEGIRDKAHQNATHGTAFELYR